MSTRVPTAGASATTPPAERPALAVSAAPPLAASPGAPALAAPALGEGGGAALGTRVLIVDDEAGFRSALEVFLSRRGYQVRGVASGADALAALAGASFEVMLCDVRMPGLSGVEVVPRALAADPDLAIVMVSAVNDAPTAADVLSRGAMDYVTKPLDLEDVAAVIARALRRRERAVEQRRTERLIRAEVALRTEELERRTEELEREQRALRALTVNVAETLVNAMEAKDVYLRGHSLRVADLGASIAEHLGLVPDTVEHVRLAGHLHDVGKIGIREGVLNKPGPLTPEEFAHVKDHVRIGMEILTPLRHLGPVLAYVHDHHERRDGSGYPRGLRGEGITLGGRILAAADTFDALTSRRAYRQPMTGEAALEFMARDAGSLIGEDVFEALRAVVERGSALVFIAAHAAEE